ncbi:sulfotransferase [Alginatibacterium sediminis]|uniref:Sulfotransferase n=1 Tax=Alginatibacterium sediminis TaxID=2164068 RepID=A0A420E790_9ALTE|nr:sulfotransferase domain-containing protein [Alginatibacterium sediminis]RKF14386.1 sulfotransferase [Alginatibacterium sediminis]
MKNKIEFLVAGTQKGGTTALDVYLREHAALLMAKKKELHFFDQNSNFRWRPNYRKYHQSFDMQLAENRMLGECTPIYMYWESAMRRIFEYNPQMKLIAVLRSPVERAFSHWNMEKQEGYESLSFEEAIAQEAERCRHVLPLQHRHYSYLERGFYSEQIRRMWRYFPKEQTYFCKNEDLKFDTNRVLNELSGFLDIPAFESVEAKTVHSRTYSCELEQELRTTLNKYYQHEISQLEQMLNWDCSDWR